MLVNIFDDESDFLEEKIESFVDCSLKKTVIEYFNNVKNKKGKTIMETNKSFPSENDLKFIKETNLVSVLDFCYPILEKIIEKEEASKDVITKDTKIILSLLQKISNNNIPKSFSAGILYYEITHCFG